MSLTPPGLVSGPALIQQPPLIPPVSAPQPVDTASQSKTDSGASGQKDSFVPQRRPETGLVYARPDNGTASADAAAINSPATAPVPEAARAAASAAYAMVADAPTGMPPSILTPLKGL